MDRAAPLLLTTASCASSGLRGPPGPSRNYSSRHASRWWPETPWGSDARCTPGPPQNYHSHDALRLWPGVLLVFRARGDPGDVVSFALAPLPRATVPSGTSVPPWAAAASAEGLRGRRLAGLAGRWPGLMPGLGRGFEGNGPCSGAE